MAMTYRSKQRDMVDLICWKHYGFTRGSVEAVLEANRGLADQPPILPAGLEIILPDIGPPPAPQPIRLWD